MKKIITLIVGILFCLNVSFAQKDIKIANIDVDVTLLDDGKGRYYCIDSKTKEPINGKLRIAQGVLSQYIDAEFSKGYAAGTWKSYNNNKLVSEVNYTDGFPDGEAKEYFPDGSLAALLRYSRGEFEGQWFIYYDNEKIESISEFKDGKPDGLWITYYKNGQKESEKGYKAGKEDGIDRKYDEDGNIRRDDNYKDGKQVGKSVQHFFSNTGNYVRTANYKDGVLNGEYSEFFENGNLKSKGKYVDGTKHGNWDFGKSNGNKTLTEEYDNGDVVRKITYFTDGSIDTDRQMKNGKNHGTVKKYEFEGGLKSVENYNNGVEDGQQMKHMKSNVANYTIKSNYANGKRNGAYVEEYDGGVIKEKGTYINDKKHGEWIYNDVELTNKGKLKSKKMRKETYDNGKLISE